MTRWLSRDQQRYWRDFITAHTLLHDRLSRELQDSFDLTIGDYEIMVRLSESPDHRMRMSELADACMVSRSRLSHQIDRMSKAGYISRVQCPADRRGQFAKLTKSGMATLVAAAPMHVNGVRNHLLDVLTDGEFTALGKTLGKVARHLESLNGDASD